MIKNSSLKIQLLVSIYSIIIIGITIIFYIMDSNLKEEIDKSKYELYSEKVDNIIYFIDQKYQKLLKTQMRDSYEKSFKEGTLKIIEEVFDKKSEELYPIIIDENRDMAIHRDFNTKTRGEYKNREDFKLIVKMKSGELNIFNKEEKWVIFKYYEPWDWIIGYVIPHSVKYKELYEFREIFFTTATFILLLIYFLTLYVIRSILHPVEKLTNVTKQIASGNYNTSINISGAKELTILANNFENMRNKINMEMEELVKSEKEIDALNKNLLVIVDERTKELKEQKESFETLFNESTDGLSIYKDGIFVDCNNAMLELIGIKKKNEFIGLSPFDFSPQYQFDNELSKVKGAKIIDKCLKDGSIRFEWVHKKVTGEEFWAEILLIKIVKNDEIIFYANCRDISDKKELEVQLYNRNFDLQDSNDELETMIENLKETQAKLVESEKLAGLGSMVAAVANEIDNPVGIGLTASSNLELISELIIDKLESNIMNKEDFKDYLGNAYTLAKVINVNLKETVEIVKNFKQVAIDQTSEQKRVFNVNKYIKGTLISFDAALKDKNISVEMNCDENLEIISYPGFFAQIITSLVKNSIEHGFKNLNEGKINFNATLNDSNLIFEYSDNGVGISKENLLKIYEPFFTTNVDKKISGLGLSIVYNLVTINLNGTIDCKSEQNQGVLFTIKIPI